MAETIADYLVKLGFKVEKGEEARFNATLGNLAKTMAGIATALTAAATAISATVIAVSKSLDELYWTSQRTGASVTSIKALSYALSQVGGSAGQAVAAYEGLAAALRTNPGTESLLKGLGISTRENGQLRETGALIDDIVEKLGKRPYYVSSQIAGLLGIGDERAWNTFVKQHEEIKRYQKEAERTYAAFGVDPSKAAESSNRLMTSIRSLMLAVEALALKVTVELQPILLEYLKEIQEWFVRHQDQIVRVLEQIVRAVGQMAQDFLALARALEPVVTQFLGMTEAIAGENGLRFALEGLLIFMAGKWIAGILGSLALLAANPTFLALLALAGIGYDIFAMSDQDKIGVGGGVNDAINGPSGGPDNWWTRTQNRIRGALGMPEVDNKGNARPQGGGSEAPPAGRSDLAPIRTKSGKTAWVAKDAQAQFQGLINDLEAQGYEIKDIGGFANRANVNNPSQMSKHSFGQAIDINPAANPNGTTQTDLPANTADLAKKWGLGWGMNWRSTKDPMHFSTAPNEGGRMLSPEELKQLQEEQAARLKDKQSELMGVPLGSGSSRSASIDNKTSITIYGSTDPAGTAANLGGAQGRVSAELIRNAQSAFV